MLQFNNQQIRCLGGWFVFQFFGGDYRSRAMEQMPKAHMRLCSEVVATCLQCQHIPPKQFKGDGMVGLSGSQQDCGVSLPGVPNAYPFKWDGRLYTAIYGLSLEWDRVEVGESPYRIETIPQVRIFKACARSKIGRRKLFLRQFCCRQFFLR